MPNVAERAGLNLTKRHAATMGTAEKLQSLLHDLDDSLPSQIEGSLIASGDGFLVGHTLGEIEDAERVAAMVATTVGVSRRMADTLSAGAVKETSISAENRIVQLYLVGDQGALAVVAEEGANVALINLKAREQVEAAKRLLTGALA